MAFDPAEDETIGERFFGTPAPWAPSVISGPDPIDLENLPSIGDPLDLQNLPPVDPELLKLFRQQRTVQGGESALAGIGPGAESVPGVNLNPNVFTKVKDYAGKLLKGEGSASDYITTLAGVAMLAELMKKRGGGSPAWQGKVAKSKAPLPKIDPKYFAAAKARPYGSRAMGMNPFKAAEGGIADLARGGRALPPRYLRGETDGMADKIPSNIDGRQPAKLSHGEFVIPADVVSHLGNGNSDAGAKMLYKMMDRVRQARTGTKKQGKQIRPEKFMPGGIAGYAGGGAVAFAEGGDTTVTQGLAPWSADYIAGPEGYLSKAWTLSEQPYQAYEGPLTAGTSPLQQQAFKGVQNLKTPGQFGTATTFATEAGKEAGNLSYKPTTFSTGLGKVGSVQSYMNPYIQNVIDIQAREARRTADVTQQAQQAKMAQAGGFGGARDAIMRAELARNLGQQIGDIQEKGLSAAYDRALAQRLRESELGLTAQKGTEESKQFGAKYGLDALGQQLQAAQTLGSLGTQQFGTQLQGVDALLKAGDVQQKTEQAGIDALIKQFQEAQRHPYANLEFMRNMMQNLPVSTRSDTTDSSFWADLVEGTGGLSDLYDLIAKLENKTAPAPAPAPPKS